jgi:hypothetical protein
MSRRTLIVILTLVAVFVVLDGWPDNDLTADETEAQLGPSVECRDGTDVWKYDCSYVVDGERITIGVNVNDMWIVEHAAP